MKFVRAVCAALLLPLAVSLAGCKMDSTALASYKDGSVTRGELKQWLKVRRIPPNSVMGSIENQKTRLRQIAAEKLTVKEAEAAGVDKSPDFLTLEDFFKKSFASDFYSEKLRKDIKFKEEAAKVSIIKLRVLDYVVENNKTRTLTPEQLDAEFAKQTQKAEELIKQINGNADFKTVAEQNSDDYSKNKGGDIGFITKGMREAELSDAVFSLKAGEMTQTPLRLRDGVYIIKVNKRLTLTNKNIASAVDNEKESQRLGSMLRANAADEYINALMKVEDVSQNIDDADFAVKDTLLYQVGDTQFKVSDFDTFVDFFNHKVGPIPMGPTELTIEQKRETVKSFFSRDVLYRDAMKNNLEKDKDFKEEWNERRATMLGGFYKNTVLFTDVKASNEDILREYNDYVRQMTAQNNNRMPNDLIPFAEAKPRIESMLINRQLADKNREYEDKLLADAGFTINESKLEQPPKPKEQPPQGK